LPGDLQLPARWTDPIKNPGVWGPRGGQFVVDAALAPGVRVQRQWGKGVLDSPAVRLADPDHGIGSRLRDGGAERDPGQPIPTPPKLQRRARLVP
jgi:hypothetical protein